jgi:cell division protein FtsN
MKKYLMLGAGLCLAVMITSCKSSESAYKKAYEKAKQQELAQPQVNEAVEVAPVVSAPVVSAPQPSNVSNATVREEKVSMVSGEGIKNYSVVCGSFGVKANAEGLKDFLDKEGYNAQIVYNPERQMYRVVAATYDDKAAAAQARDEFKAKYPSRSDFQGSWLLYRVY